MSLRDRMLIRNLKAVLMYRGTPVLKFNIENRFLVEYEVYQRSLLPPTMKHYGISYYTINDFFKYRVCMDGSMLIGDYINDLGLKHYDFEQIVRRLKGKNGIDDYSLEIA